MDIQSNGTPRWCVRAALVLSVMTNILALSVATITLFWERCGVTMAQGLILQVIFALTIVGFEVPTGLFADVKRRKVSIALGLASMAAAEFAYGMATSFIGCVLAEVVCAVALSFLSGAVEAYVYDALPEENREVEFRRLWSLRGMWVGILGLSALPVGNWLGGIDLSLPFFVTATILSCGFVVCLLLREPRRSGSPKRVDLQTMVTIARECLVRNRALRWLAGVGAINMLVLSCTFWLYVPLFREAGVPLTRIGVVLAVFNGVFTFATWKLRKAAPGCGEMTALLRGVVIAGVVALLVPFIPAYLGVVVLLVHQIVRATSVVWFSTTVNRLADETTRATVLSLQSLVSRVVYAAGLGVVALALDVWGTGAAYASVGVMTIFGCSTLLKSTPKV